MSQPDLLADPLASLRSLTDDGDVAKRFGLPDDRGKRLSRAQWRRIELALQRWSERLVKTGRLYPARSYRRGMHQVMQFLHLVHEGTPLPFVPRADRSQIEWLHRYTENELAGAMARYADEIKSAILYGLHNEANPTQTAAWLHKATHDAQEDWRLIAQTETARANALGRYDGCERAGYDKVWIPPHAGSCEDCKRLIENRVFTIDELREATNYKRRKDEWVPALPLHPRCLHCALPWEPSIYEDAQREYEQMRSRGLDDAALDEMFDSSGQLRPQYVGDPRLAEIFAGKTVGEPYALLLGRIVEKHAKTSISVSKGFFDPPHRNLDPLIWDGEKLKPDARDAILSFWTGVLGEDWEKWAALYITGSATSYQWETGWSHPWLGPRQTPVAPDVDTHLVIDYQALRKQRPLWSGMTPMEIRKLLEAWVDKAKQDVEIMPGLRLDAFIRLETTRDEFETDVAQTRQGVYDVTGDSWLIRPTKAADAAHFGQQPLGGMGGFLAEDHPDWMSAAEDAGRELQRLLDAYRADPTPENLDALRQEMDTLYEARSAGFLGGEGQASQGNWTWVYLENFGTLVEVKNALRAAPR